MIKNANPSTDKLLEIFNDAPGLSSALIGAGTGGAAGMLTHGKHRLRNTLLGAALGAGAGFGGEKLYDHNMLQKIIHQVIARNEDSATSGLTDKALGGGVTPLSDPSTVLDVSKSAPIARTSQSVMDSMIDKDTQGLNQKAIEGGPLGLAEVDKKIFRGKTDGSPAELDALGASNRSRLNGAGSSSMDRLKTFISKAESAMSKLKTKKPAPSTRAVDADGARYQAETTGPGTAQEELRVEGIPVVDYQGPKGTPEQLDAKGEANRLMLNLDMLNKSSGVKISGEHFFKAFINECYDHGLSPHQANVEFRKFAFHYACQSLPEFSNGVALGLKRAGVLAPALSPGQRYQAEVTGPGTATITNGNGGVLYRGPRGTPAQLDLIGKGNRDWLKYRTFPPSMPAIKRAAGPGDLMGSVGNWFHGLNQDQQRALAGAGVGGLGGVVEGAMTEGNHWLRNGILGALLGGGAGYGYGPAMRAWNAPTEALGPQVPNSPTLKPNAPFHPSLSTASPYDAKPKPMFDTTAAGRAQGEAAAEKAKLQAGIGSAMQTDLDRTQQSMQPSNLIPAIGANMAAAEKAQTQDSINAMLNRAIGTSVPDATSSLMARLRAGPEQRTKDLFGRLRRMQLEENDPATMDAIRRNPGALNPSRF